LVFHLQRLQLFQSNEGIVRNRFDLVVSHHQIMELIQIVEGLAVHRCNVIRCQIQESQFSALGEIGDMLELVEFQFSVVKRANKALVSGA